jgi:hypothetical protein
MIRSKSFVATAGLAILVVGCATIVEGTDQTVTVTTTPSGAICELKQNDQTIAVVNPSPGSASVSKSKRDISVICSKEGYQGGGATLSSKFQGMTFGNILFGGVIGVAVDAGSGAMHEYQPSVHVTLIPEEFASPKARDEFFDTEIARITREAAEAVALVQKKCNPDQAEQCEKTVAAVEKERDAQVAELEIKRAQSRIAGG